LETSLLLEVEQLETAYGASQVLFGVSFSVNPGEAVTLLGRNGMGKTTTIRSIMGLTRARAGAITFRGQRIERAAPDRIARMGMALVPEGRQIFPNLSVRENLVAFSENRSGRPDPWTPHKVLEFFPRLAERSGNMGNQLSGGEQQMLAIGRALMGNPSLLLPDEPLEGLAPIIVEMLLISLKKLISEDSLAVILVEQHAKVALSVTETAMVLSRGRVTHYGPSAALLADPQKLTSLIVAQ
jgi:branched-chain amino acid transport system ATP-binding protein